MVRSLIFLAALLAIGVGVYRVLLPALKVRRAEGRLMALRAELRQLARDSGVAARLIAGERERHPELSEAACIRRAIKAIRHDRR